MKNKIKKVINILCILFFIALMVQGILLFRHWRLAKLDKSKVYVSDTADNSSEFDLWIKNTLDIHWVPTYIIIRNGYVVGYFAGDIPLSEFSDKISDILEHNKPIFELPDILITNLNGETKSAKDIFNREGETIIELVWQSCKDCEDQDKFYTKDIYWAYTTENFFRYYINTPKNEVKTDLFK